MKPKFFYNDAVDELNKEINNMIKKGQNVDPVLDDIGLVVEMAVRHSLPRSKKHHVHMQDDTVHTVRTSKRGERYVSIRGGKETGYKWHIVNDGHLSNSFSSGKLRKRDGSMTTKGKGATFVAGLHFIDKAMVNTQSQVEMLIDEYVEGIVNDGTIK